MSTQESSWLKEIIQRYPDAGTRLWLTLKSNSGQMPPDLLISQLSHWEPKSILELGAGYGLFSHYLARRFPQSRVLGIDLNPKRIEQASASASGIDNLAFRHQNALEMEEDAWDCIIMIDVLHHVGARNQAPLLQKTWRLLRPGGRLLIREIEPRKNLIKTWNAHLFDTAFYWEISHFLAIPELSAMLSQAGFSRISVTDNFPKSWVFPYVTYLSCKDPDPSGT